jgi:hypothetical protein
MSPLVLPQKSTIIGSVQAGSHFYDVQFQDILEAGLGKGNFIVPRDNPKGIMVLRLDVDSMFDLLADYCLEHIFPFYKHKTGFKHTFYLFIFELVKMNVKDWNEVYWKQRVAHLRFRGTLKKPQSKFIEYVRQHDDTSFTIDTQPIDDFEKELALIINK